MSALITVNVSLWGAINDSFALQYLVKLNVRSIHVDVQSINRQAKTLCTSTQLIVRTLQSGKTRKLETLSNTKTCFVIFGEKDLGGSLQDVKLDPTVGPIGK